MLVYNLNIHVHIILLAGCRWISCQQLGENTDQAPGVRAPEGAGPLREGVIRMVGCDGGLDRGGLREGWNNL